MNIYEALNSGKPFRRASSCWPTEWYTAEDWLRSYLLKGVLDEENQGYLIRDLRADDWVLRPDAIPIYPDLFWAACLEALKAEGNNGNAAEAIQDLATRLGFRSP